MSNFIATYITIGYTSSAILADYTTLHMTNTVFQFIWWILFMLCLFKSPGFVPDETVGINRPPASTKPPYEKNTIQGQRLCLHVHFLLLFLWCLLYLSGVLHLANKD